jgi:hypothetical protein
LNGGKRNLKNTELPPQAIWPIAKSFTNRDGPRAPTAIHGLLDLKYHLVDKANAIADCLENQFTPQDLFEENHEWWVEARVKALLKAVDSDSPERIRPCDLQTLSNSSLAHLSHLINHCIRLSHFPKSWKEVKVVALPRPGKDLQFPQNLHPISLLSSTDKVFEKFILEIVKRHIGERNLLNTSQLGFRARHSTTLQL